MRYVRNEAPVVKERSAEGSKRASEGGRREEVLHFVCGGDTIGHDTGARAGGYNNVRKSEVVKRPSKSHARSCLALRLMPTG
jgi:hypothetical protein